jgi:hypothetical protein
LWRIALKQLATINELETVYSFDDMRRMHAILNMTDHIEKGAYKHG